MRTGPNCRASTLLLPVFLTTFISLNGCFSAIRDQAQVDPVVASVAPYRTPFGDKGQPQPIVPNCSVQQWVDRASGADSGEIQCAVSAKRDGTTRLKPIAGKSADAMTRRTLAQAELMTYSDQVCDDHIAGIYAKHAGMNFDLGFLTTLFSGGAAVASGRAATNLSAESALFSGTRSLVNAEVYYGYIGPAVMREIHSLRSDLRTQIAAKRSCTLQEYPPQEAIDDALIYHDACSFSTGLASLLSKAGDTRVGEDKLRVAQLKAVAAQLSSKRTDLTKAESELKGIADTEANGTRAQVVRDRIAALTRDIAGLESVLRFAGVVDESAPTYSNEDLNLAVQNAQERVQSKQQMEASATPDQKLAAQEELEAAKRNLEIVRARRDAANALSLRISTLETAIESLSSQKIQLASERDRLPASAIKRRDSKEKQIGKISEDIEAKKKEVAEKQGERVGIMVPDTTPESIRFGIQQCTPVKLGTAR